MEKQFSRPRQFYLDVLRILACYSVVLFHASIVNFYQQQAGSRFWVVSNLVANAARFGVPVFVMISGALFLDPDRRVTIRSIWTHSLPRLAIVYGAWSLIYAVQSPEARRSLYSLAKEVVYGASHLWFLWMLAGLYLFVPLLRPIAADRRLLGYGVAVTAVGAIVLPALKLTQHLALLNTLWQDKMLQGSLSGYLFYFLAGAYLARTELPRAARRGVYLAGGAALIGLWGVSAYYFQNDMYKQTVLVDFTSPLVAVYAVAVFVAARRLFPRPRAEKQVVFVSSCTLGVYLIHLMVQTQLLRLTGLPENASFPLLCVLGQSLACFGFSLAITGAWRWCTQRVKRWLRQRSVGCRVS